MLPQIYQWILWTPFIGEESNMVSMLNIAKVHVFYWRGPVLVLPENLDYLRVQTPWIIGCLERGLCLSSLLCLLFSFSGWWVNHFVSLHAATMKCHPYLRPKSLELLTLNRNIQESKSNNNFHFEFNCLRYYSIMTSWINCLVHKHGVWLVKTHKKYDLATFISDPNTTMMRQEAEAGESLDVCEPPLFEYNRFWLKLTED